ncbi:Uncharacterized protein DBV15_11884 [Temnothorax longispinosus]|uniref:Transposable element P transposase-like GTP-binding insertion domain-containing protein n=1 Tax=Temnothorax longispinosus TaxID=300112 RepID=A0A4S2KRB2_9HYME|nr:Uncharacterized protein DBV15_11884 [Temnothorax longispinosus]
MKRNFEKRKQAQTFEVGNVEVVPLFDPPHLIKGIRNNLLTKDLTINCDEKEKRITSWDVIKTAWIMDKKLNTIRPQLKKITKEHIEEDKIKKMRVKHATQVLSGTLKIDTEEGITTAETVLFFNDLFDSVNGSEVSKNDLRSPVTEDSAHHAFWTDAKNRLRKMCYVHKVTGESISVPSLKN